MTARIDHLVVGAASLEEGAAWAEATLGVVPGPSFATDGAFEHFLRLPYTLPERDLDEAVRTLAGLADRLGAGSVEEPAGVV